MKNNQAGALLARYTFLREHPSLQHCDFELGKVDWAYIDAQEWNQTQDGASPWLRMFRNARVWVN